MSSNRIITLTILLSFVVFGIVGTGSADDFNRDQFLGVWYAIGLTSETYRGNPIVTCYSINITEEEGRYQNFKQEFKYFSNGVEKKVDGYGKFIGSEIHVLFPFGGEELIYTASQYYEGKELILFDKTCAQSAALLSRIPIITVETRHKFRELARQQRKFLNYFSHDDCPNYTHETPLV